MNIYKINDIFRHKTNKTFYVLTKIINDYCCVYTNLNDKYTYTIQNDDLELWYESK